LTPGTSASGRNVPDIVLPGEIDGVGPSLYYEGQWQGGSPFVNNAPMAGYLATVQQMYGYATPIGNIAPSIWGALQSHGYGSGSSAFFTDITLGCIGAVGNVPVCAAGGYDLATGIGSIASGYALAKSFAFGPLASP
jgi:hypothetical protein